MLRFVATLAHNQVLGAWWGFAEADRVLLGLVVVVLAVLAVAYLVVRATGARRAAATALRHRR